MIVKGENRDTAWFSMLDGEWPNRKAGFERWLDPANFDADGKQKSRSELFVTLHHASDSAGDYPLRTAGDRRRATAGLGHRCRPYLQPPAAARVSARSAFAQDL